MKTLEHTGFAPLVWASYVRRFHQCADPYTLYRMPVEKTTWTNNDITNYYITLPRQNVETGFWLERWPYTIAGFQPTQPGSTAPKCCDREFKQRKSEPTLWRASHFIACTGLQSSPYRFSHHGKRNHCHATSEGCRHSFSAIMLPIVMLFWRWQDILLLKKRWHWQKWFPSDSPSTAFPAVRSPWSRYRQRNAARTVNGMFRWMPCIWLSTCVHAIIPTIMHLICWAICWAADVLHVSCNIWYRINKYLIPLTHIYRKHRQRSFHIVGKPAPEKTLERSRKSYMGTCHFTGLKAV